AVWMQLAFLAGHDLGRAHPEALEDVLPGHEARDAMVRVGTIQHLSEEPSFNCRGMQLAFNRIVEEMLVKEPKGLDEGIFLQAIVKSLRAGFAAGTISRFDPMTSEFLWDLPERIGPEIRNIVERVVIGAPLNAVGQPIVALLEHPLIRLA